jgi:hypothetical protein
VARPKASTVVRELLEESHKKKTAKKKPAKRRAAPAKEVDDTIDRLLERVSAEPAAPPSERRAVKPVRPPEPAVAGLRTARIVTAAGRAAEIQFRGERAPSIAAVADEVESEVLQQAAKNRDSVLVEVTPGAPPLIVGIVQTRMPRNISLKGATVEIEAEREILLKTGRGALRIREDGDIELVGSRILAMSRGLFRIVGRMLRLN